MSKQQVTSTYTEVPGLYYYNTSSVLHLSFIGSDVTQLSSSVLWANLWPRKLKNTFILSRVFGNSLHLEEISLEDNLQGNSFRLTLDGEIVSDVFFKEEIIEHEIFIYSIVVTDNNILYVFKFKQTQEDISNRKSIFFEFKDERISSESGRLQDLNVCRGKSITSFVGVNSSKVFVGCSDGSIIFLDIDFKNIHGSRLAAKEYTLKEQKYSFWSSIWDRSAQPSQVVSLCGHEFGEQTFIFALYSDNILRIWSLYPTAVVIYSTDLGQFKIVDKDVKPVPHEIKFLSVTPNQYLLVIKATIATETQFYVFGGDFNQSGKLNFRGVSCKREMIIDFQITSQYIWILSPGGNCTLQYCPIPQSNNVTNFWSTIKRYSPVPNNFKELQQYINVNDIDQYYLDIIFNPGGFPENVVVRAFNQITGGNRQFESISALKSQLRELIFDNATLPEEKITVKITWELFLQECIKIYNSESTCIGFYCSDSGFVSMILYESVSLCREERQIGALYSSFSSIPKDVVANQSEFSDIIMIDSVRNALLRVNYKNDTFQHLRYLLNCMFFLSNQLEAEVLRDLEEKMYHFPSLEAISKTISWFGIMSKTFENNIKLTTVFKKKFLAIDNFKETVSNLLDIIDPKIILEKEPVFTNEWVRDTPYSSNNMDRLIFQAFVESVNSRFILLRDLMLVISLASTLSFETSLQMTNFVSFEDGEIYTDTVLNCIFVDILPPLSSILRRFFTLKIMCNCYTSIFQISLLLKNITNITRKICYRK